MASPTTPAAGHGADVRSLRDRDRVLLGGDVYGPKGGSQRRQRLHRGAHTQRPAGRHPALGTPAPAGRPVVAALGCRPRDLVVRLRARRARHLELGADLAALDCSWMLINACARRPSIRRSQWTRDPRHPAAGRTRSPRTSCRACRPRRRASSIAVFISSSAAASSVRRSEESIRSRLSAPGRGSARDPDAADLDHVGEDRRAQPRQERLADRSDRAPRGARALARLEAPRAPQKPYTSASRRGRRGLAAAALSAESSSSASSSSTATLPRHSHSVLCTTSEYRRADRPGRERTPPRISSLSLSSFIRVPRPSLAAPRQLPP